MTLAKHKDDISEVILSKSVYKIFPERHKLFEYDSPENRGSLFNLTQEHFIKSVKFKSLCERYPRWVNIVKENEARNASSEAHLNNEIKKEKLKKHRKTKKEKHWIKSIFCWNLSCNEGNLQNNSVNLHIHSFKSLFLDINDFS